MVERLAGIILPVFSIIALGWLYAWRVKPDMATVNRISMNVLAPAPRTPARARARSC